MKNCELALWGADVPCHSECATLVFQAVRGLVLDLFPGGFLCHVRGETSTLNHEILNHAVEDRTVEELVVDVLAES